MTRRIIRHNCILAITLLWTWQAFAQAPRRDGRLLITIVDQSSGILPGATVTVTGIEPATSAVAVPTVFAAGSGIATVSGLLPGRYSVQAEFDGFETGVLKDVRVRTGDNRQLIVLTIRRLQESVTVGQDAQAGAADRKSGAFGTALTREQVDALSDDPNEMQKQLQDMAGPGAVLRIDSFEGGALPPKSQIKAIHITRDQFAAENHSAEGLFIDIITQPGVGPIRTNMNYQAHNTTMVARNAFSPTKGADQVQNFGLNIGGGLIRNKASFSLGVRGATSYDSPIVTTARKDGTSIDTLTLRSPREQRFVNGNFDYAVTPDQTLRASYTQNDFINRNVGVGGFNEAERASTTANHTHTFRIQEAGPIGRRFFTNTRLNLGWSDSSSRSAVETVTIRVLDAFTTGGAQVAGGRHSRDLNLASDLDYVRGIHSLRVGTAIDANWFHSDDTSNYLGTYTFENLEAYAAGRPRSFVRRIGNPAIAYHNFQAAFYAQDDIRLRRSLTLTAGIRYEAQDHLRDYTNIGPRIGMTWAPFRNGRTTIRGSWGRFYDWLNTNTYEQTLRVDGFRQRELQVLNPSYPDPGADVGTVSPVNRYVLGPGLNNAESSRSSTGVDYAVTQRLHVIGTYRYVRGLKLLHGLNLNAPVNGARPDASFGNIVQVMSDGHSRQHILQVGAQTPPPPPIATSNSPVWDWKRWGFFSSYVLTSNETDSDGAFQTPATGVLADDWGTANGTARDRVNAGFTASWLRNLTWQIDVQMASGTPYNIVTGTDDNGDLIFNDRPAGVARNTGRTSAQISANLFGGYSWTFGPRVVLPGGPLLYGTPAGVNVTSFVPPPQGRFRIGINVVVTNLTNRANLNGYSGQLTSPLYGQPTGAAPPRRVNVGVNFSF